MNWIKQNKKLATILGVMIAGGIGLGVMLYLAWADFSAKKDEWTDLDRKATALENSKFTPNADNVALLGQKLDEYREKFSDLQTVLLSERLQQKPKPISETDFQARLKERARAVVQKAGKVTDLPKDFALGFDEYTASLPVNADVAAKLNVQLDVMEKFVNALLEAGVKSVDVLERTKLPEEQRGAATTGAPAPKPPTPPKPLPGQKKPAGPAPVVVTAVVDRYPIKCLFTCDSGPLQAVMNSLANPAKIHDFLAVRQLHVENEKKDAPSKDEVRNELRSDRGDAAPPREAPTPKGKEASMEIPPAIKQKKDAASIMGNEAIKVYMEVDYLRFRDSAADGTPAPGAAAPAPAPKR